MMTVNLRKSRKVWAELSTMEKYSAAVAKYGSPTLLAEAYSVPRQTIYNIRRNLLRVRPGSKEPLPPREKKPLPAHEVRVYKIEDLEAYLGRADPESTEGLAFDRNEVVEVKINFDWKKEGKNEIPALKEADH